MSGWFLFNAVFAALNLGLYAAVGHPFSLAVGALNVLGAVYFAVNE